MSVKKGLSIFLLLSAAMSGALLYFTVDKASLEFFAGANKCGLMLSALLVVIMWLLDAAKLYALAMAAGELTLGGRILSIGGIKEKIIRAKRNGAEHVVFPKQNIHDLDEIPDIVKEGIQFHPVERFEEVLAIALPET